MNLSPAEKIIKYDQLAKMINDIEQEQLEISNQLALLRANGETKSQRFRELMSKKLTNLAILNSLEKYQII